MLIYQGKKPLYEQRIVDDTRYYGENGLPDSVIAAMAIATGGKSKAPIIAFLLISHAAKNPDKAAYTINDFQDITGISRLATLSDALKKLKELAIVRELPPIEYKELMGGNSRINTKNTKGRGASKRYQINLSRDSDTYILQAIESRLVEKYLKKQTYFSELMAGQIDLQNAAYDEYLSGVASIIDKEELDLAKQAIASEMRDWQKYLLSKDVFTFTPETLPETLEKCRLKLMRKALKINPQRFVSEWARILGCSKKTVTNIRKKAKLLSVDKR
jgi:hypothetical protein